MRTMFTIYQLPIENKNVFQPFNKGNFKMKDYERVYDGIYFGNEDEYKYILEEIFIDFNIQRPCDYNGRSISMSDVVEFMDGKKYYCDRFGWVEV